MTVRPPAAVQALRHLRYTESRRSLRPCTYFKANGYTIPSKAIHESQISRRVFSSFEPREAKMSSGDVCRDEILSDCGSDQDCAVGGIVALGKFDALHIGHRELAIEASKIGSPLLLSFVGMEKVFGWPYRPPIVAKCDRKRVLSSWASLCGNVAPLEIQVEFSKVRHLTPRQFVEKLSKNLRISGVVAGENYRFGYKASGDAEDLVRLCQEYGLEARIVGHVLDTTRLGYNGAIINGTNSNDKGQVSSTRVRHALAMGDLEYVTRLLGRKHRLLLMVNKEWQCINGRRILAPKSCVLNQTPGNGEYDKCGLLVDDVFISECRVAIHDENLEVELFGGSISDMTEDGRLISIEFG